MHGPYYTDRLRCTVHIIQIGYDARSILHRYTTMHGPYYTDILRCTVHKTLCLFSYVSSRLSMITSFKRSETIMFGGKGYLGSNDVLTKVDEMNKAE
jgi:hypothetical protein